MLATCKILGWPPTYGCVYTQNMQHTVFNGSRGLFSLGCRSAAAVSTLAFIENCVLHILRLNDHAAATASGRPP